MSDVDRAVSCYMKGFVCSQAILSTYGLKFGLNRDISLKISAPFGGGLARMGKICGAVTGAFMVIGLKYGYINPSKSEEKEKMYGLVKEYVSKFNNRNGTIICKELLDCDISTSEGRDLAIEKKLFIEVCPKFIRDSAEILETILDK